MNNFYEDFKKGEMPKFLGDGDYDYQGYKLFSDGSDYVFPAGCPVVIKNNTFNYLYMYMCHNVFNFIIWLGWYIK